MNVSISREKLEALLGYASDEIDTRRGHHCRHHSEAEINKAQETLAAVRSEIEIQATMANPDKAKLHQPATDVRHPYYEMGDELATLEHAIDGDPVMQVDAILRGLVAGLQVGTSVLRVYLDATYRWD